MNNEVEVGGIGMSPGGGRSVRSRPSGCFGRFRCDRPDVANPSNAAGHVDVSGVSDATDRT